MTDRTMGTRHPASWATFAILLLAVGADCALAGTTTNSGGAGTPIPGPSVYQEFRQPDRNVDWNMLAAFIDRGVGDSRHSRYFMQQFRALFPGTEIRGVTVRGRHALTRQCGNAATPCTAVPAGTINNEFWVATFSTSNGSVVELTASATGSPEALATSGGTCRDCSFRNVGALLAKVTNERRPGEPVGHLYMQTASGRVIFQNFSSTVTLPGGGAAPFTGPSQFDEDTAQSWEADVSYVQLPEGAYNARYRYRWRASDGTAGDGATFTHAFAEPGEASLSLEIEATYTLDVARTECTESGRPPVVNCVTRQVPESQGPASASGGRRLRVRDITAPDLTVNLAQGRILVAEEPRDVPPIKTARVVTTGRFEPQTNLLAPPGDVELGRYQIEKNRAFAVETAARDNSGIARATWHLDLSGAGVGGSLSESGGRVDELEANYPVGSVDYRFTASAVDGAGNASRVACEVEVRDLDLPEVPLRLTHPPRMDEDTLYELVVESDLLQGEVGEPLPHALDRVVRDFVNPTWAGEAEFEKAIYCGENLGPALEAGRAFTGRTAEIRSVERTGDDNRMKLRMRLLVPGQRRLDLWLRRKFNYEQRVGRSGIIKKTQMYVKSRASFPMPIRDITPPELRFVWDPPSSALPRVGSADVRQGEVPLHCEPRPNKMGAIAFRNSKSFSPDLKALLNWTEGPMAMRRSGSEGPVTFQSYLSRLQRPATTPPVLIARDFFIPEDVPISFSVGSSIVVTDNLTTRVATVVDLVVSGCEASTRTVASAGFPAPNYMAARVDREGKAWPPKVPGDGPSYLLQVSARDEAGNENRLDLPVVVLDVTPPDLTARLLGQDANGDAELGSREEPPSALPENKMLALLASGFYLDPGAKTKPEFPVTTRLGYPPAEKFFPASGPRLPWTFGLYKNSHDNDPANTDGGFGPGLPDALTGLYIRQNVRVAVKLEPVDNVLSSEAKGWLEQNGLRWSIKTSEGTTVDAGGTETFLMRAPNYPREQFPGTPEYRFAVSAADAGGNVLCLELPLWVLELGAEYRRIDWEQRRSDN